VTRNDAFAGQEYREYRNNVPNSPPIRKLKAVHTLTHPAAKVDRPVAADDQGDVPDDAGTQANDADIETLSKPTAEDAQATLFATLATEAEEEATTGP
jgi:hypothetical protein